MSTLIKSATIQLRVTPLVKAASEHVLWGIGMSMSEAVELFLRRIIVDERIPFEIVALDAAQLEEAFNDKVHSDQQSLTQGRRILNSNKTGDPAKEKIENLFRRGRTSTGIRAKKARKRGTN